MGMLSTLVDKPGAHATFKFSSAHDHDHKPTFSKRLLTNRYTLNVTLKTHSTLGYPTTPHTTTSHIYASSSTRSNMSMKSTASSSSSSTLGATSRRSAAVEEIYHPTKPLPPKKPNNEFTRRPSGTLSVFFWRWRMWFEATFVLSMLEPWEKIMMGESIAFFSSRMVVCGGSVTTAPSADGATNLP